jgi:predicted RNA methylase
MSATNRGAVRNAADFYPTPPWVVHRLLEAVPYLRGSKHRWLEAGAGRGAIIDAATDVGYNAEWTAVEQDASCIESLRQIPNVQVIAEDFLGTKFRKKFTACIMNPPYRQAAEFIEHALGCSDQVFALLRLNYLGSTKRAGFLRTNMPDVYVLPQRPSFTGSGTDATEYAWMRWGSTGSRRTGSLMILKDTPIEERG